MGVFAIRVFAGGALVGNPPSDHTKKTPFFPLALYQRDQQRADELTRVLPVGQSLTDLAVQFVLRHPAVSAAIIGFSSPEQVDEVAKIAIQ
jgi:aryl-alcohol dehydrogenase-like predicted oxidoreductase